MKATELLHEFGQSLWLDNITRDLLNNGTLKRCIDQLSVTGLTSNPTLLHHAIKNSSAYDDAILGGLAAGHSDEKVGSVASVFVSRWDSAVASKVPPKLRNQLGVAVARRSYKAYLELLGSARSQRIFNEGAVAQRLLWASTGTKDPNASDTLYVETLAAPFTVNTMPEATLKAFADHGEIGVSMPQDGGDSESVLAEFAKEGVDLEGLADRLQEEGAAAFVKSWNELLAVIESKSTTLRQAA